MDNYAKTELHLHLDGSIRPHTILELARMQNIELPADDADSLHYYCTVPDNCRDLKTYLERFELPLLVLQTERALSYAAHQLVITLYTQGVTHAEIRFAPQLHMQQSLKQENVVEAVLSGVQKAMAECAGIQVGIILCMMVTGSDAENQKTAVLSAAYQDKGVCGIDLAGQEDARPLSDFASFFAFAKEKDVNITIHAGEACSGDRVLQAISMGAKRIGHGTRIWSRRKLVQQVAESGVTLEQCVTSNIQTRCVQGGFSKHPIKMLFDAGVRIAVCTDNMTVSGTSLAREYCILKDALGFSEDGLAKVAQYAKEAAFL